eukprot:CAMPEP_0115016988 /NCGR_PEP_ID=MMETSP0216-20121206/27817_1 /TAXON_ID=223996 /ORGANISM="Protocruzia adherens, Strain Boccale" /LENGTH=54 /DNA_ID=CAMNT_0002387655 /DNA_START=236 /DNA_END=400 /DNA_ORIENTATION=-
MYEKFFEAVRKAITDGNFDKFKSWFLGTQCAIKFEKNKPDIPVAKFNLEGEDEG